MLPTLMLLASIAGAQQGGDLQAQILYAYQTEDNNQLSNLVQSLSTQLEGNSSDVPLRYHLAHAQYRLGLLAGAAKTHQPESAFAGCVDDLKPALDQDVKSAEALALQGACYDALANFRKLEAVLLRSRGGDRLREAYKLAPRNPRVVYLLSIELLRQSKPGTAGYEHAYSQLQLAGKLFEESSATRIDTPGWGHAECYLALGLQLKSRGDRAGARNWIEKSLIIAPDYKAAQRQLSLLSSP